MNGAMRAVRWMLSVCVLCAANMVAAQDSPPDAPVQNDQRVASDRPSPEASATAWNITAGGTLSTGDTRAFAANAGTHFVLTRGFNVVTADVAFTYGIAALKDKTTGTFLPYAANTRNLNGSIRYDRFLTEDDALFVRAVGRNDPFAELDLRFQGQLGYARNIWAEANHRFWAEVGYDFTYDVYTVAQMISATDTSTTKPQHSGRLFVGYDNHVSTLWQLLLGVESLFDVVHASNVRINSIDELNLAISTRLKVGVRFSANFSEKPPVGAQRLDTTTIFHLVYSLL